MALVVIEAPGKVDTVTKGWPLSGKMEVVATYGHLFDLPKFSLGVEQDHINLVAIRSDLVRTLRDAMKSHEEIFVATDPDREGEVIAAQVFELAPEGRKITRVYPRALDRNGLEEALSDARPAPDPGLAMAGLTRRVVDRLIGFTLSRQAARAMGEDYVSIGRVKSAVLRKMMAPTFGCAYAAKIVFALGFQGAVICNCTLRGEKRLPSRSKRGWVGVAEVSGVNRRNVSPVTTAKLLMDNSQRGVFRSFSAYRVAQALYEKGTLSYVRTREQIVTPAGIGIARQMAGASGMDVLSFLEPSMPLGGHESIRPAGLMAQEDALGLTGEQREVFGYVRDTFLKAATKQRETEIRAKIEIDGTAYDAEIVSDHPDILDFIKVGAAGYGVATSANAEVHLHDLIHWMDKERVGTPGTYVSSVAGLMESEYLTPGLHVTDKGKKVLEWLDENAPWLNGDTSKQLDTLLDQVREGKNTYQDVFDALQDFSAESATRLPAVHEDPAKALKKTVRTMFPGR